MRLWLALALSLAACGGEESESGGKGGSGGVTTGGTGGGAGAGTGASAGAGGSSGTLPDSGPDALDASPPECSGLLPAAGDYDRTVLGRPVRVHVPPSYDPTTPMPVVLFFHGGGGNADAQEALVHLIPKADAADFILVRPEGIAGALTPNVRTWNAGNCCGVAKQNNVDDVAFVNAILDALPRELCVDLKRIYASGFSNGGMFSHRLACELSERIAAIAPVSGGIGDQDLTGDAAVTLFACNPTRKVPVLHIHGFLDEAYPYAGGKNTCVPPALQPLFDTVYVSVPVTMDGWRARNQCGSGTTTTYSQGQATCESSDGCAADVTLCTIADAKHDWPGGDAATGPCSAGTTSSDLAANDFIWDYFVAHPMP